MASDSIYDDIMSEVVSDNSVYDSGIADVAALSEERAADEVFGRPEAWLTTELETTVGDTSHPLWSRVYDELKMRQYVQEHLPSTGWLMETEVALMNGAALMLTTGGASAASSLAKGVAHTLRYFGAEDAAKWAQGYSDVVADFGKSQQALRGAISTVASERRAAEVASGETSGFTSEARRHYEGFATSMVMMIETLGIGKALGAPSIKAAEGAGRVARGGAAFVNQLPLAVGFAFDQYNEAFHDAKNAGLDDSAANYYALRQAAVEGGIQSVFSLLGLGGLENTVTGTTRHALRRSFGKFLLDAGVSYVQEVPEEWITNALQATAQAIALDRKSGLSKDELATLTIDTLIQVAMMTGVTETTVYGFERVSPARARAEALFKQRVELTDDLAAQTLDTPAKQKQALELILAMEANVRARAAEGQQALDERTREEAAAVVANAIANADTLPTPHVDALVNAASKPRLYRGGGESAMPEGETAAGVVKYEQEELGNTDVMAVPGYDLSQLPAKNLRWVTTTEEYAAEFGEVTDVTDEYKDYVVVATDGDAGVLLAPRAEAEKAKAQPPAKSKPKIGVEPKKPKPKKVKPKRPKPKKPKKPPVLPAADIELTAEDEVMPTDWWKQDLPKLTDEQKQVLEREDKWLQGVVDSLVKNFPQNAAIDADLRTAAELWLLGKWSKNSAKNADISGQERWKTLEQVSKQPKGRSAMRLKLYQALAKVAQGGSKSTKGRLLSEPGAEVEVRAARTSKGKDADGPKTLSTDAETSTGKKNPEVVKLVAKGPTPAEALEAAETEVDTAAFQKELAAELKNVPVARQQEHAAKKIMALPEGHELRVAYEGMLRRQAQARGLHGAELTPIDVVAFTDAVADGETDPTKQWLAAQGFPKAERIDTKHLPTGTSKAELAKRAKIVEMRLAIEAMREIGVDLQFYSGITGEGGWYLARAEGDKNAVVVLEEAFDGADLASGVVHESIHHLAADFPTYYAVLKNALPWHTLNHAIRDYQAQAPGRPVPEKLLEQEGVARAFELSGQSKSFWDQVYKASVEVLRKLARIVRDYVNRFLNNASRLGLEPETFTELTKRLGEVYGKVLRDVRDLQADATALAAYRAANLVGRTLGDVAPGMVSAQHASPHKFDRFSTEFMGSGEGAQAFGWGLYFTDEEAVADVYAGKFKQTQVRVDGQDLSQLTHTEIDSKYGVGASYSLFVAETEGPANITELEAALRDEAEYRRTHPNSYAQFASGHVGALKEITEALEWFAKNKNRLAWERNPSYRYKATLWKDHKETLLEWTAEVSDLIKHKVLVELAASKTKISDDLKERLQSKTVSPFRVEKTPSGGYVVRDNANNFLAVKHTRAEADAYIVEISKTYSPGHRYSGESLYWDLSHSLGSDKAASEFLLRAGIDGIKYPTGTLSSVKGSAGYNYVVFDASAISIEDVAPGMGRRAVAPLTAEQAALFEREDVKGLMAELAKVRRDKTKAAEAAELRAKLDALGATKALRESFHNRPREGAAPARATKWTPKRIAKTAAYAERLVVLRTLVASFADLVNGEIAANVVQAAVGKNGKIGYASMVALTRELTVLRQQLVKQTAGVRGAGAAVTRERAAALRRAKRTYAGFTNANSSTSMEHVVARWATQHGLPWQYVYVDCVEGMGHAQLASKRVLETLQEAAGGKSLRKLHKMMTDAVLEKAVYDALRDPQKVAALTPAQLVAYNAVDKHRKAQETDVRVARVLHAWREDKLPQTAKSKNNTDIHGGGVKEADLVADLVRCREIIEQGASQTEVLAELDKFLSDKTWGVEKDYAPRAALLYDRTYYSTDGNPSKLSARSAQARTNEAEPEYQAGTLWTRLTRNAADITRMKYLEMPLEAVDAMRKIMRRNIEAELTAGRMTQKQFEDTMETLDTQMKTWLRSLTGHGPQENPGAKVLLRAMSMGLTIHFATQMGTIQNVVQMLVNTDITSFTQLWAKFPDADAAMDFELTVDESAVLGASAALRDVSITGIPGVQQAFGLLKWLGKSFERVDYRSRKAAYIARLKKVLKAFKKLKASDVKAGALASARAASGLTELTDAQWAYAQEIWVARGVKAMARWAAGQHVAVTFYEYMPHKRSFVEQGKVGRIVASLYTFPRCLIQRMLVDVRKVGQALAGRLPLTEGTRAAARIAFVYVMTNVTWNVIEQLARGMSEEDKDKDDERGLWDTVLHPRGMWNSAAYAPGGYALNILNQVEDFMRAMGDGVSGETGADARIARTVSRLAKTFVPFYRHMVAAINIGLDRSMRRGSADRELITRLQNIKGILNKTYEYEQSPAQARTALEAFQAFMYGKDTGLIHATATATEYGAATDDKSISDYGNRAGRLLHAVLIQGNEFASVADKERARVEGDRLLNYFERRGIATGHVELSLMMFAADAVDRLDVEKKLRAAGMPSQNAAEIYLDEFKKSRKERKK